MVFKKYIKRGGKVYGPYLYENKRIDGKVVTSYVGKYEESGETKKGNRKVFFYILPVLILFLLISFIFYQGYDEFLTGRSFHTGPGRDGDGGDVDSPDEGDGDDKDGVPDLEEDPPTSSGTVSSSSLVLEFSSPLISIEIPPGSVVSVSDPVRVKITQGVSVSNVRVGWKINIKFPPEGYVEQLKIGFSPDARFVNVGCSEPVVVSITPKKSFGNIGIGKTEAVIKNPQTGFECSVTFSTNAYYISRVETIKEKDGRVIGNRVWVVNSGKINYEYASIITNLDFVVRDADGLKVLGRGKEEIHYISYDPNGDGAFESVRFIVPLLLAKSTQTFDIFAKDIRRVEATKKTDYLGVIVPTYVSDDLLSVDCKEKDLSCEVSRACSVQAKTDEIFTRKLNLGATEELICVSENANCLPVVKLEKPCSIAKKITVPDEEIVEGVEPEIYFGPPEVVVEEGREVKKLGIYDKKTGEKVVAISVKEKKVVDIIFTQGPQDPQDEDIVSLSPPLEENDFSYLWWILLVLLIPFLFLNSSNIRSWKIDRLINRGDKALDENDLRDAISNYYLMRGIYLKLNQGKKERIRQDCLEYYVRIKDKLTEKNIKVEYDKIFGNKLPHLIYDGKNFIIKRVADADISRVGKLIDDGIEALHDGDVKVAVANYNAVRQFYSGLDRKDKGKVKRKCHRYFKKLRKYLEKSNKRIKFGQGFLPEIEV